MTLEKGVEFARYDGLYGKARLGVTKFGFGLSLELNGLHFYGQYRR